LIKKELAVSNGLLTSYNINEGTNYDSLIDNKLVFHAKTCGYGASVDFARYLKGKDFLCGFQVPFGYKAHRLKLSSDINFIANISQAAQEQLIYASSRLSEILNYALVAKNLWYHPKTSITGIGDITTFLSLQINTKYVERLLVGLKALWPTSKDPDTRKLWAPSLGKGFTTLSWYGSVLFHQQRSYLNPHMMMEISYSWPAHKKRRVPKKIVNTNTDSQSLSDTDFARGNLIQLPSSNRKTFSEWDTYIPGFADNVRSVKITPGAEVYVRLGNIFEKVIFRESFLDVFYDFRAKFKDRIGSGLARDVWNPDILNINSHEIEHRICADFTYQFDGKTRLQTGFKYAFDGVNVPEAFECNIDVNIEF
jgi:hypothetical protein